MLHPTQEGGLTVEEGNEHPSHLNTEGQNAQHTSNAGEALSGGSSSTQSRSEEGQGEKKGGKPVMEKYAYHSMFIALSISMFYISSPTLPVLLTINRVVIPFLRGRDVEAVIDIQ